MAEVTLVKLGKFFLVFLTFAVILALVFFAGKVSYDIQEKSSTDRSDSLCILLDLSDLFNQYYVDHRFYPSGESWLSDIRGDLNKIKCGRYINTTAQEILDAFGDRINYIRVTESEAVVYSENVTNIANGIESGQLLVVKMKEGSVLLVPMEIIGGELVLQKKLGQD
jgi:hypothetical protein